MLNINLETAICDLCLSKEHRLLYKMPDIRSQNYETEYSVVECLNCGHRYLSPRPASHDMSLFYSKNYYANRSSENTKQKERYIKQAHYLPQIKNGKILDIGCAGGDWLKTVQEKGWDCYGYDIIESSYKVPDINITHGQMSDTTFDRSFFDVVTAWGVMEHIYEPSKYFDYINGFLKDNGLFIFMVPNADGLWSRWAFNEDIPRHLHFFRARTLKKYAKKYGFKLQNIHFTNDIYSRPATGRGLFRKRLLRYAGATWKETINPPPNIYLDLLGKAGSLLDYCLINPKVEEILHICGNMVVIFKKESK